MPTVIQDIAQYSERVIDRTKKRVEHAQFLFGVYAILLVGIFGSVLQPVRAPSWMGLAISLFGTGALFGLLQAAAGKKLEEGIAFRWSVQLQARFPRWRWLIGSVLNGVAVFAWPPLAHVYAIVWVFFTLTSLVEPEGSRA